MKRQCVDSSSLRSVGYVLDTLEIEFKESGVYQYYHVPEVVYRSLMAASSLGRFFHYNIRDKYQYRKVE